MGIGPALTAVIFESSTSRWPAAPGIRNLADHVAGIPGHGLLTPIRRGAGLPPLLMAGREPLCRRDNVSNPDLCLVPQPDGVAPPLLHLDPVLD